jgi:hypothetical protein
LALSLAAFRRNTIVLATKASVTSARKAMFDKSAASRTVMRGSLLATWIVHDAIGATGMILCFAICRIAPPPGELNLCFSNILGFFGADGDAVSRDGRGIVTLPTVDRPDVVESRRPQTLHFW